MSEDDLDGYFAAEKLRFGTSVRGRARKLAEMNPMNSACSKQNKRRKKRMTTINSIRPRRDYAEKMTPPFTRRAAKAACRAATCGGDAFDAARRDDARLTSHQKGDTLLDTIRWIPRHRGRHGSVWAGAYTGWNVDLHEASQPKCFAKRNQSRFHTRM
jgi:hypothetical protein